MMRIGLLHSRIRAEERLLVEACAARGLTCELLDARGLVFELGDGGDWGRFDVVLDRCVSLTHSQAVVPVLESLGVRCVNPSHGTRVSSCKLQTNLALLGEGLPVPRACVGVGEESGVRAIERVGYPAVVKPTVGSWGRLVSRVGDRDGAEAVVEHRCVLGHAGQSVIYAQEHIDKPGRDLRVFVAGGRALGAISRRSEHWVTNTARGAVVEALPMTDALESVSLRAARAVGLEIAAVDLLECPQRGLLVNEVNHSMEFRNSGGPLGVDLAGEVIDAVAQAEGVVR